MLIYVRSLVNIVPLPSAMYMLLRVFFFPCRYSNPYFNGAFLNRMTGDSQIRAISRRIESSSHDFGFRFALFRASDAEREERKTEERSRKKERERAFAGRDGERETMCLERREKDGERERARENASLGSVTTMPQLIKYRYV